MSLLDALPSPRLRWEGRHPNTVLVSLSLIMLAALWILDVVTMAPNRIVQGTGYGVLEALGWPGAILASLLFSNLGLLAWQPLALSGSAGHRHYVDDTHACGVNGQQLSTD